VKVLVCGSRGWKDPLPINAMLAGFDVLAEGGGDRVTVIHGGARGADTLAKSLAVQWGLDVIDEPADWDTYGRAAGPIRNQKMLDKYQPDVVLAFRTYGKSTGTDDMVARARKAGIPTFVITGGTHPTT